MDKLTMPPVLLRASAVEKFRSLAEKDSRVIGAFLGGSLAAQTADEYSDIDVYYIIKPDEYSGFLSSVRSFVEKVGPLAYLDQHNDFGFDLVLFMFLGGVKGELGLGTVENMKNLHAGPFEVLCDKANVLKQATFPYEKAPEGAELRKHVEKQLRWYWYWYGIVLTSTARGHLWSALSALNTMRGHVFTLLRLTYNLPPGAKTEKAIPSKLLKELGKTIPSYSSESMRKAAARMTAILKRETKDLLERTGAEYPSLFEKTVMARHS